MVGVCARVGSNVKGKGGHAARGWAAFRRPDHTERRLIAQAFVFTYESKVTPIGDIGICGPLLLGSLVKSHNAPYKLTIHE
jgi:hypothetical protein